MPDMFEAMLSEALEATEKFPDWARTRLNVCVPAPTEGWIVKFDVPAK